MLPEVEEGTWHAGAEMQQDPEAFYITPHYRDYTAMLVNYGTTV
jgi:hypothetical protein